MSGVEVQRGLTAAPSAEDSSTCPRHWTRADYYRAAEAGVFRPDEKLELIEGEIWERMRPQGAPHATAISQLLDAFYGRFGTNDTHVRMQMPITLSDDTEPEPDFVVVAGRKSHFGERHPDAEAVLLLVEVSDTTLLRDRVHKACIYATAGIREYWILDLNSRVLEVYREPASLSGVPGYRIRMLFTLTDRISPLCAPDWSVAAAEMFPPEPAV